MSETSPEASIGTRASVKQYVAASLDQPRLHGLDGERICVFLPEYDAYKLAITARALQLGLSDHVTIETVKAANLRYCVDTEQLEAAIDLGFIDGVDKYEGLTDGILRTYLEGKCKDSVQKVTVPDLDSLVEKDLKMGMSVKSARTRMELLFMSYTAPLRCNGVSWVLKDCPKVSVRHVLAAIKPTQLKNRLESDLSLSRSNARKNFK